MKEIQKAKDEILDHLDQNQRSTVESILKALDEGRPDQQFQDQLEETFDALLKLLTEIKKKGALDSDLAMKEEVNSVTKIIEDYHINHKRKLEVTIPLIPLLLAYKWEVEFEGGGINLKAAWNKLINYVQK